MNPMALTDLMNGAGGRSSTSTPGKEKASRSYTKAGPSFKRGGGHDTKPSLNTSTTPSSGAVGSTTSATYTLADRYEKLKLAGSGSYGCAWIVKRSFLSINEEETLLVASGAGKKQIDEAEKQFYTKSGHRKRFIAKEILLDNGDGDVRKLIKRTERAGSEVRVLSRLRHPNIIQYIEEINEWDRVYIVMEYASGGDLKNLIKRKKVKYQRFTEAEVLNLFTQLVMGLKHIHGCALLHRDIKPANLFLTSDLTVIKIGDFGLTKQLSRDNLQAQTVCGTPANYAPEICNESSYTSKADMWAAGCILHELMSLEHPFVGGSKEEVFKRILSGNIVDPNPNRIYSPQLVNLSRDLLQQDPNARPSASDVLMDPVITKTLELLENEELLKLSRSSSSSGRMMGSTSKKHRKKCESATAINIVEDENTVVELLSTRPAAAAKKTLIGLDDLDDDDLISVQPGSKRLSQLAAMAASVGVGAGGPSGSPQPPRAPGGGGKPPITPPRTPPPPPIVTKVLPTSTAGTNANPSSRGGGAPLTGSTVSLAAPPRNTPHLNNNPPSSTPEQSPMATVRAEQKMRSQQSNEKHRAGGGASGLARRGGPSTTTAKTGGGGGSLHLAGSGGGRSGMHLPSVTPPVVARSPRPNSIGNTTSATPRPTPGGGVSLGNSGSFNQISAGCSTTSDDEPDEHRTRTRQFVQHELRSRSAQQDKAGGSITTRSSNVNDARPPSASNATPGIASTRPSSRSPATTTGSRTAKRPGAANAFGAAVAMSRSEFEVWLTKRVSTDTLKRKRIRDLIAQVPAVNVTSSAGGALAGPGSPTALGGYVPPPVSVHRRCEIFDKCVEELNDFYNQQVHMTLMAIVFG